MRPHLFAAAALLCPALATADGVQRYALTAGANHGGSDRVELRYAVSDAERFAEVMTTLGGVAPENALMLEQPDAKQLSDALDTLRERISKARRTSGGRTELILYYSGHADDQGLLLGGDRYSYRTLRARLDEIPADVRIAVLDACASGAFTRIKGGKVRPPFLVDDAARMRGHAFLTSSAESEAAQESDRIGASYFTHYLVSGLRGAADVSGEGKVTLNEAYQFAFNETLGRTVATRAGAQHPSYDINMSGTGDVVMTDLRQTTATLVLDESLDGRFFVHNKKRELVVEVQKPYGRRIELGLEPGTYDVVVEREAAVMRTTSELAEGGRVVLGPQQFTPTEREVTRERGGFAKPLFGVSGRNRIDLRVGMWGGGGDRTPMMGASVGASSVDLLTGLRYSRYVREDVAVTLRVDVLPIEAGNHVGPDGVFTGAETVVSVPFGVRWNPTGGSARGSVKPYLAAGLGPVFASRAGSGVGSGGAYTGTRAWTTLGGFAGGGVDLHVGRNWSLGVDAGYTWMPDFSEPLAGRDNYSGFNFAVSFGFLFGRGSGPAE